jgi:hypothetical protein
MKTLNISLLALAALLLLVPLAPASRASDWDKSTTITFDNPVAIPGQVLPAGTYIFKTADAAFTENVVQIWNGDQTQLVATLNTITDHVARPYEHAVFNTDQSGSVPRLESWFYPGDVNGFQFNYSMTPNEQ